jgi:hypothetical protein
MTALLVLAILAATSMSLQSSIRDWNRRFYQDLSKTGRFTTATTTQASWIVCPGIRYTIFVQRIRMNVVTDAAQTLTLQDTNGTPKVIGGPTASSPGLGWIDILDGGDEGIPLTEGKDLSAVLSAAGLAFDLVVEAYAKPTSTRALSEI